MKAISASFLYNTETNPKRSPKTQNILNQKGGWETRECELKLRSVNVEREMIMNKRDRKQHLHVIALKLLSDNQ